MSILDVPMRLPVSSLSVSSINTFIKCPERWRRKYLLHEQEKSGAPLIIGSAVGAACNTSDQLKIESGRDLPLDELLDAYGDEFALKVETETDRSGIEWDQSNPAKAKDAGAAVLEAFHRLVLPTYQPVSVEREFVLQPPDAEWVFRGYIDVETADGKIRDRKVKGKAMTAGEVATDIQATAYLLARREEARAGWGEPATGFVFDVGKNLKTPTVDIVPAPRTDAQLDALYERILKVAAEIAWRTTTDNWGGAVPGSWWCSDRYCAFFATCQMGGRA